MELAAPLFVVRQVTCTLVSDSRRSTRSNSLPSKTLISLFSNYVLPLAAGTVF